MRLILSCCIAFTNSYGESISPLKTSLPGFLPQPKFFLRLSISVSKFFWLLWLCQIYIFRQSINQICGTISKAFLSQSMPYFRLALLYRRMHWLMYRRSNVSLIPLWHGFYSLGNSQCLIRELYEMPSIRFKTFFVEALLLIVHTWNSSPLQSNLFRLQWTCCTVPTTSGRPHGSPLVWACQWPSSPPLSSAQLYLNDRLRA